MSLSLRAKYTGEMGTPQHRIGGGGGGGGGGSVSAVRMR